MKTLLTDKELDALRQAVLEAIEVLRKQAVSGNRDAARILLQYGLMHTPPAWWSRGGDGSE